MARTDIQVTRERVQAEAVLKWRQHTIELNGNVYRGRLEIGTGVGKSKIACDILKQITSLGDRVLILTPSTELRDYGWPEQIAKHYSGHNLNITYRCYQSGIRDAHVWHAVIADEYDFALTEEYSQMFHETAYYRDLIALTAYVPDHKKELAEKYAPLCYRYTTQDAQRDGILNKTKFYQVNFDLSHKKNIEVKYKKNGRQSSFFQSENGAYLYQQEQFAKSIIAKSRAEKEFNTASLLSLPTEEAEATQQKAVWAIRRSSGKRKDMLHTLESSVRLTKLLIQTIRDNEDALQQPSKFLIFSKLTSQAERISEHTYHAKNKNVKTLWHPDEASINNLQALSRGSILQLGVCEAVNRGINLDSVNCIIQESYVGSDTDFQQKHGRGTRLDALDTLHYFILVPHYWDRIAKKEGGVTRWEWQRKPTQAQTWMNNMIAQFDMEGMEIIDVVYDSVTDTYKLPPPYDRLCVRS